LKFRHPCESPDQYRELYDNAATHTWPADQLRSDWDLIVTQISSLIPSGGKVLDFGCYAGGFLSRLDASHQRFGIEVNQEAARVARVSAQASVWGSIDDLPVDLRFDVIVISDVIEHVYSPRDLLERLADRLASNGAIIVTTGDGNATLWRTFGANWWYCFYPEHISFISKAWVEHALCKEGWNLISQELFRYRHPGLLMRSIELLFTCLYGFFPRAYLWIGNTLRTWMGRGALTSVPGNGITRDHLMVVLSRTVRE
jgi:SAM-dependent methyltransferase